jgi:hypothetical protein
MLTGFNIQVVFEGVEIEIFERPPTRRGDGPIGLPWY